MGEDSNSRVIRAAGGIIWEGEPWQSRIAVIFRNYHRDWSLPKGKLEDGESFEEAAIREIKEETGCAVQLHSFAGDVHYEVNGRPKIVKYWHFTLIGEPKFQPNKEVAKLRWLNIDEALELLDYESEREFLNSAPDIE